MRAGPGLEASGDRFTADGRPVLIGVDAVVDLPDPGRKYSEQFGITAVRSITE